MIKQLGLEDMSRWKKKDMHLMLKEAKPKCYEGMNHLDKNRGSCKGAFDLYWKGTKTGVVKELLSLWNKGLIAAMDTRWPRAGVNYRQIGVAHWNPHDFKPETGNVHERHIVFARGL